jgi:O-antigen ligase
MSGKSDFLDYEPLTKSGKKDVVTGDEAGVSRSGAVRSEQYEPFRTPDKEPADVIPPKAKAVTLAGTEPTQWVLKSGHLVSFLGLFVFTFLLLFRPYEWNPSLSWLLNSALITAIVTLVVFIPTQLALENRLSFRPREVNLVLLLLVLGLLSVLFASDKLRAWNGFVGYLKVVVIFIVMVNVVRTPLRLKAILFLTLIATVILSLSAIDDYRSGNLILGGKRIAGVIGNLFDNPNDLALHFVTFFPVVFGLALGCRNLLLKMLYFVVAMMIVAGVVVTFSRGGFIGLLAVVGTIVWKLARGSRLTLVLGGTLLLGLFLIIAPSAYRERIVTSDDSSAARTDELKRSVYITLRHPIVGVGMDNFIVYSNREHATHNSYTQVSSEIGVAGCVVYVMFLIAALKRAARVSKRDSTATKDLWLSYLGLGLQASLVGFIVTSFFASVAYLWYIYYLVGYTICVSRLKETSERRIA